MSKLGEYYSVWKWSFLGWALPGVVCVVLAVAILTGVSNNPVLGTVLGLVASVGIATICFVGFGVQVAARAAVVRHVVFFCNYGTEDKPKPIAFRIDPKIKPDWYGSSYKDPYIQAHNFLRGIASFSRFVYDIETAYKDEYFGTDSNALVPITFITLKSPGTLFATFMGTKRRCRGVQVGHWCEVEWDGDAETTMSLIKHELSHVLLSTTFPMYSVGKQHRIMRDVLGV
jgi:hypothetical protein